LSGLKSQPTISNAPGSFTAICSGGKSIRSPGRRIIGGADETPDGALKKRKHPQEPITNYISVNSVTGFAAKIEKLGGKICMSKTAVPQMGYFAICQDTEGNTFAIWESDENAK
jgi:predicted enzyme related to lactoylglutathione lyase